jgi:hypothetical protein
MAVAVTVRKNNLKSSSVEQGLWKSYFYRPKSLLQKKWRLSLCQKKKTCTYGGFIKIYVLSEDSYKTVSLNACGTDQIQVTW